MTEPLPNLELIDRVMSQIKAEPERWNQDFWINFFGPGGTSRHCFGGWAIVLAGLKFEGDDYDVRGGDPWPVARELLGLTENEASALFTTRDLSELEEVVAEVRARYDLMKRAGVAQDQEPDEETKAALAEVDRQFDELTLELFGLKAAELMRFEQAFAELDEDAG